MDDYFSSSPCISVNSILCLKNEQEYAKLMLIILKKTYALITIKLFLYPDICLRRVLIR
jgi:hypothetical protein